MNLLKSKAKTIHMTLHGDSTYPLCGSGKNSYGSKRSTQYKLINGCIDDVTCKRCLELAKKHRHPEVLQSHTFRVEQEAFAQMRELNDTFMTISRRIRMQIIWHEVEIIRIPRHVFHVEYAIATPRPWKISDEDGDNQGRFNSYEDLRAWLIRFESIISRAFA